MGPKRDKEPCVFVQAETDVNMVRDASYVRQKLGVGPDKDNEGGLEWTELHDALTSMRAHDKPISKNLTADDLDLINAQVRCCEWLNTMTHHTAGHA